MNEHTPGLNPIETRETPEAPRDIENQMPHLDAPGAEMVAETAVVSQADTRNVVATVKEAQSAVPDAVKTDASRRAVKEKVSSARARGVEWVRASDLLSRGAGRMAGVGIRLHQAAGAQTRRGLAAGMSVVSKRVRELPPVSAFGRRTAAASAAIRSGVGMR